MVMIEKKFAIPLLIAAAILTIVVFNYNYACPSITKKEVLDISQAWIDNKNYVAIEPFKITNAKFEGNLWNVEISGGNCLIYLVIDECGSIDVGGTSSGCNRVKVLE